MNTNYKAANEFALVNIVRIAILLHYCNLIFIIALELVS